MTPKLTTASYGSSVNGSVSRRSWTWVVRKQRSPKTTTANGRRIGGEPGRPGLVPIAHRRTIDLGTSKRPAAFDGALRPAVRRSGKRRPLRGMMWWCVSPGGRTPGLTRESVRASGSHDRRAGWETGQRRRSRRMGCGAGDSIPKSEPTIAAIRAMARWRSGSSWASMRPLRWPVSPKTHSDEADRQHGHPVLRGLVPSVHTFPPAHRTRTPPDRTRRGHEALPSDTERDAGRAAGRLRRRGRR